MKRGPSLWQRVLPVNSLEYQMLYNRNEKLLLPETQHANLTCKCLIGRREAIISCGKETGKMTTDMDKVCNTLNKTAG